MTSPPKIKKPARLCKSERGEEVNPNKREHSIVPAWSIPHDYRDGLEIYIAAPGNVVLRQQPLFGDVSEIVLHATEARALRKILPAAIAGAEKMRKAAHG